jgi:L-fuconolactonase
MSIDSHQHFWQYSPDVQVWIDPSWKILQRDYSQEELAILLRQSGFTKSIAVQASQTEAETDFLLKLAAAPNSIIAGVVGWCDLRSDPETLRSKLSAWKRNQKLVGMRHVVHDEEDDNFILKEDFRRGLGILAESGLTYDLLLFPKHIQPSIKVVQEFPQMSFILDHIAKPFVAETTKNGDRVLLPPQWERDIRELASHKNVFCKLSGLPTLAAWSAFSVEDFFPFLDVVVDAFGKDRVMIGSDWPVCTLSADYEQTMNIVKKYMVSRGFSTEDTNNVLGGNCLRAYKITTLL